MSAAANEAMKKLEMVWRARVRYIAIRTTPFPTIANTPEIQLNTARQINAGDMAEGLVVSFMSEVSRGSFAYSVVDQFFQFVSSEFWLTNV